MLCNMWPKGWWKRRRAWETKSYLVILLLPFHELPHFAALWLPLFLGGEEWENTTEYAPLQMVIRRGGKGFR